MNKAKFLTAAALTIAVSLLAGCGEKKIDGATDESFNKSAQSILESLPAEKRLAFVQAVSAGPALGIHEKGETFAQSVNGKTADEVVAYFKKGVQEKTSLKY